MQTKTRLEKIEKKSFKLGNDAYKTYKQTKSLESLKFAIRSYETSMRSIKYQLIFNNLKK